MNGVEICKKTIIKVIQFNADRGRTAMSMVKNKFINNIALLHHKHKYLGEYKLHKNRDGGKTEIWTKKNLNAVTVEELMG